MFTIRNFKDEDDFIGASEVYNACPEHVDTITPKLLKNYYRTSEFFNPYTDLFLVVDDQTVIGYGRMLWRKEKDGNLLYLHMGHVHPKWRRRGIGNSLFGLVTQRAMRIAQQHRNELGAKIEQQFLHGIISQGDLGGERLMLQNGYALVRQGYFMRRDLAEPLPDYALPPEVELKPPTIEDIRALWLADQLAFQDHWGAFETTESDFERFRDHPYRRLDLSQMAQVQGHIVGQVNVFINNEENAGRNILRGWTEDISVAREWRRKGIARALIVHALQELKRIGYTEAMLGVDSENISGAMRVYQDCGFKPVGGDKVYRKPLTTPSDSI
jgi:ribosomal protein S18 acetylase RimI-like enzyme